MVSTGNPRAGLRADAVARALRARDVRVSTRARRRTMESGREKSMDATNIARVRVRRARANRAIINRPIIRTIRAESAFEIFTRRARDAGPRLFSEVEMARAR